MIDNEIYIDGGFYDNCPIKLLIDKNIITRFKKEEYRYRIVKSFNYEDKIKSRYNLNNKNYEDVMNKIKAKVISKKDITI